MLTDFSTLDPDALHRRRQMVDTMRTQSLQSTGSFGGAMGALGQALLARFGDRRLDPHEDRARDTSRQNFVDAWARATGSGGYGPPMGGVGYARAFGGPPAPSPVQGRVTGYGIDPTQTASLHAQPAPPAMKPQAQNPIGQLMGEPFRVNPAQTAGAHFMGKGRPWGGWGS